VSWSEGHERKELATYRNGERHGRTASWNADGDLTGETIYVNGAKRRVTEFRENGSIRQIKHYPFGPVAYYHPNGQIGALRNYEKSKDGLPAKYGPYKTWNPEGQPVKYGTYDEDAFTGTEIEYFEGELEGQIKTIRVYEDDVERELTRWSRDRVLDGIDRRYKWGYWIYDENGRCTSSVSWDEDGNKRNKRP
jgi:antitoxin component YwqK of YwqJK toxin-antitoxin module